MDCDDCRFFDSEKERCSKLKHNIRNGYAMKWHSERCGEGVSR